MSSQNLLEPLVQIAREAGAAILDVYATDFAVRQKADRSPVTEADVRAEKIILAQLARLTPDIPIVSEEAASEAPPPPVGDRFWLVDPLDGTREFVRRGDEFTVNIALVQDRRPQLGLIYAPALDRLFIGRVGDGAWAEDGGRRRAIRCRAAPSEGATVITSYWHQETPSWKNLLHGRAVAAHRTASSSLKFGLVAAGEADIYPRTGRTWEWDTAAGQAIIVAAGGRVTDGHGAELLYRKLDFVNPAFVAYGITGD